MENQTKLYNPGLEEYPKTGIILRNIIMLLWIALGTIACWFIHPLIAWLYFAFSTKMVFIVLRKMVCTNCCYYAKWCSTGWGKLSCVFFKKGKIENFKTSTGIKIAPFTYGLLALVPFTLLIISLIQQYSTFKLAILALLLSVSVYSGAISRKQACIDCKMKTICPGSAAK